MKKIAALIGLGTFLITVGILTPTYAYPRLAVVPVDLSSKVVAENPPGEPATYFSIAKLGEETTELGNQTKAAADSEASEQASDELGREVLVVRTLACTDLITVDCSTLRYPLSGTLSTFAIDRHTGETVAWDGSSLETGGEVEDGVYFEGLTIKFPFDTQQQTYGFWSADLRRSVPTEFVRETDVQGLRAYEFRGVVEPTVIGQIDVPGSLVGSDEPTVTVDRVLSTTTTYRVEPETGVIVSVTSEQDSYAALDGERAFTITDGTFTTPVDTVTDTVDEYRPLSRMLFVVRAVVPWVGTGLGAALVLVALALLFLTRRRSA